MEKLTFSHHPSLIHQTAVGGSLSFWIITQGVAGRNPGRSREIIRQKEGVYANVARFQRPLKIQSAGAESTDSDR